MSGLLDSLSSAASSLDSQRMGLDVVGQNIANVNTEGYSRRSVVLAERPPTDMRSAGRGVEVARVLAARDQYVESRLRQEGSAQHRDGAVVDALSTIEALIGPPGSGLDARLTDFFDAFSALAEDANSSEARTAVVLQGQTLARGFNDLAQGLQTAARDADSQVRTSVDQINALAAEIATLNGQIAASPGGDVEGLRDKRNVLLATIAGFSDVSVLTGSDGMQDVTIGHGRALVTGNTAFTLTIGSAGLSGQATILGGGRDITSEITGGKTGALLEVRDVIVPRYADQLDQLAFDVVSQVNTLHQTGTNAVGGTNTDFFTTLGAASGAAAAMEVDAGITDGSMVAASATGALGDNQVAQAIASLRDARVMSGGTATATGAWAQFVYRIGADGAAAKTSSDTHTQVVSQLSRLRDATSGVSIDQEAATLMRFQRAYEANARYFVTVTSVLDQLMRMVAS